MNAAVSVLLPVGLYLLFEVLLDAGLPPGVRAATVNPFGPDEPSPLEV